MAAQAGFFTLQQFTDGGLLLIGGRLYTYAAGTTTFKTAYTDQAGVVAHTYTADGLGGSYIALNTRGEIPAPLYLTSGSYDIALKRADGTTVWTRQADPTSPEAPTFNYATGYLVGTIGRWLQDLALSTGSTFIGWIQTGAGAVLRTIQAKLRETISVTDYGFLTTNSSGSNAAALLSLLQVVPSGATVIFPPGVYLCDTVDATPVGSLTIYGYGATLVNTSQVAANGTPILRLRGTSSKDFMIFGLEVSGPRLTSSTLVGTGIYASAGYPSGIDIYTARKAVIRDVRANGTYYSGIEAHYVSDLTIENCRVENHGYSGIIWSDSASVVVIGNDIDDIGSTMVTNGYGVSSTTSYDTPAYTKGNITVKILSNRISRCKRKCIDVHDGLDVLIDGNTVKGFANSGIYAVCEDSSKRVRDVVITNNRVYGDTSFVASASGYAFDIGTYGPATDQTPSFTIFGNQVFNLSAASGLSCSNNVTAGPKNTRTLNVYGNSFSDCTFSYGIALSNYTPGIYENVLICGNTWNNVTLSVQWMLLPYCGSVTVVDNSVYSSAFASSLISTTNSAISVIERNTINGVPLGAAQYQVYNDGILVETTQTLGGSLANINILTCDLGVSSDNTVSVEVDVTETRSGVSGIVVFRMIAYGNRTGVGVPVFSPVAATSMPAVTTVYGAATAPKLIFTISGNVGTLTFQPQDTFAAYIIKARAVTWRGALLSLTR